MKDRIVVTLVRSGNGIWFVGVVRLGGLGGVTGSRCWTFVGSVILVGYPEGWYLCVRRGASIALDRWTWGGWG